MNRSQKEALKEKIEKLDPQEHAQLFAIIKRYTETYTKTQTGVLVSSDNLPAECFVELDKMVSFFLDQRKWMEAEAAQRKGITQT